MTFREYLQLLRRGRWWISGGLVIGILVGIGITWNTTPTYTTTSTLYLAAIEGGGEPGQAYQGSLLAEQKAASYADLLSSERLHDDVREALGEPVPSGSITVLATAGSPVLTVETRASTPDLALRIAEVTATEGTALVAELERPLDPLLSTVLNLRVVRPAELPTTPSAPNAVNNIALGAVIGVLAGLAVTLVRRKLDRTVRSREALESITDKPPLAAVPLVRRAKSRRPMMSSDPDGAFAESFRRLRSSLSFRVGDGYRSVLVTSPAVREGKSTVACNLATALGLEGRRVLLVDADLRGSGVGTYLGIRSEHGLTAVLTGERTFEQAVERWLDGLFDVLPSGPRPAHPSELLGSDRMRKLLVDTEQRYDVVVIDAPGLLPVVDAAVLSTRCQATVLVTRCGRTTEPEVREALATLKEAGATLAGSVLLGAPAPRRSIRPRRAARRGPLGPQDMLALPPGPRSTPAPAPEASPAPTPTESTAADVPVPPDAATVTMPATGQRPSPTPFPR